MLLVSDANIFIDFEAADLLTELFRLPHEIVVPDVLYAQELAEQHADLLNLGLRTQSHRCQPTWVAHIVCTNPTV